MSKETKMPKVMGILGEQDSSQIYESKGFASHMWPVLDEYFARYKTEFEQTDQEFNDKFNKTMNGLDKIITLPVLDIPAAGVYYPSEKKIEVDMTHINNGNAQLAEILFHELNHAGEGNLGMLDYTGFTNYDFKTQKYIGVGLNEIITEMKASRISNNNRIAMYNNKKTVDKYTVNTFGYGNIIFAGSLMHHGLGIDEKDFLKATDKGAYKFDEQMAKQFATYEDYLYYRDTVTTSMDVMHDILYNSSTPPTQDSVDNLLIQYNNLSNASMWALNQVISKQIATGEYLNIKDFSSKCRHHMNGIAANSVRGLETVKNYSAYAQLTPEPLSEEEMAQKLALTKDTQIKILGIEAVLKSGASEIEQQEMLNMLISDEALDENVLKQIYARCDLEMGESITEMYKAGADKDKMNELLKAEYGSASWDNSKLEKDSKTAMKKRKNNGLGQSKRKV